MNCFFAQLSCVVLHKWVVKKVNEHKQAIASASISIMNHGKTVKIQIVSLTFHWSCARFNRRNDKKLELNIFSTSQFHNRDNDDIVTVNVLYSPRNLALIRQTFVIRRNMCVYENELRKRQQ